MRKAMAVIGALGAVYAFAADEPARRHAAPIAVTAAAPFVQLPLPATAYGKSASANLADLRIVDARGERVPFAVLAPRQPEASTVERARDATLYPLPARPLPDGAWRLPIEVTVDGERISVRRGGSSTAPVAQSAGWLIDLGERKREDPPPQSLRFAWSGPAEFTVGFRFETSDDLRQWRAGGAGQLMALASPTGALTQPTALLRADAGRFVRLVWSDVAQAPQVGGVKVLSDESKRKVLDPPTEIVVVPTPEPPGKSSPDDSAKRALHFDLGGVLPISQIDLKWTSGTWVTPARLQGRDDAAQPWRDLAAAVFYRLEREKEEAATSPPLVLATQARYVRLLPDPRAAALDGAQTQLVVQAPLASLVFATQGQPPYALQAGAKVATPSALPVATLVPSLDTERARFGRATLGAWSEAADVARAEAAQRQRAALRPWLLWSVLLAGVAILGLMVWRLSRPSKPA